MKQHTIVIAIAWLLALSGPAVASAAPPAEQPPTEQTAVTPATSPHVLSLGLKGGVGLPQIGSGLETTFQVRLEAIYLLGAVGSRLGLIAALGYSQPEASGTGSDPRLPDGVYSWSLTQRQTTLEIGLVGRIMPWSSDWNLGLVAGAQILFLSTLTDGSSGGEPFGQHDEQATLPGAFFALQAEYRLGPGALFGELGWAASFQDLETTGDLTASALGILVGYRFTFAL
jgi:hypothetical protein